MKAVRQYIDISNAPIGETDTLVIFDPDNAEISYTLSVKSVKEIDHPPSREIICLVVETSDIGGKVNVGDTVPITIERSTPTKGQIIKAIDNDTSLTPRERNGQILANLISFLNDRVEANYQATYKETISFLQNGGYFDPTHSYEVCKKRLTALQREFPDYIRVGGRYVTYTGKSFAIDSYQEKIIADPRQKRVQWGKFMQGLKLCFEALGYKIDN